MTNNDDFLRVPFSTGNMEKDWNERAKRNALYYTNTLCWKYFDAFWATGIVDFDLVIHPVLKFVTRNFYVLEIGCGIGRMTHCLPKYFGEVWAVDVSGEMVKQAEELLPPDKNPIHFVKINGKDLSGFIPPFDGFFDYAFAWSVFDHISKRSYVISLLQDTYRVLRSGGIATVQVSEYPEFQRAEEAGTWAGTRWSRTQFKTLVETIGFEVLQIRELSEKVILFDMKKK